MTLVRLFALALMCAGMLAGCAPGNAQSLAAVSSTPGLEDCLESTGGAAVCPPPGMNLPLSATPLAAAGHASSTAVTAYPTPEVAMMVATATATAASQTAPAFPTASPSPATTPCPPDLCTYGAQFTLARPITHPGNDQVDATYRYGSTQGGIRDPHHGVELLNPFGTPVLAAADGVVVVAGTDIEPTSPQGAWPITFYGPYMNFYGNLVVIEHAVPSALLAAFPGMPQPLYSLYGHLSEIAVQPGEQVRAGQPIGKVGQAGIATGPHLHFEVRLGENNYKASRNPELWLLPSLDASGLPAGAFAGRFLDSYGNPLEMESIVLQHLPQGPDGPSDFELTVMTYEEKGLVGQPPFQESFAAGGLPPGLYRISFPMGGLRQELVQVLPGQLTLVTFRQ